MRVLNQTKGVELGDRIEWAGSSGSRRKGLLGRESLEPGEGLYLVPCQWIHMFGMKIPLDIVFLHRNGHILHVHHGLKPNRLSRLVWRADGVLELPAGTLQSTATEVGDHIELIDEEEAQDERVASGS